MTFADDRALDLADVFDVAGFAVPAAYQPLGTGATTPVVVVPSEHGGAFRLDGPGTSDERHISVLVRTSEVNDPARTDAFIIASGDFAGTWKVRSIDGRGPGTVTLGCTGSRRREVGGAGARELR